MHDLLLYNFNLCYNLIKKPLLWVCFAFIVFMIFSLNKNNAEFFDFFFFFCVWICKTICWFEWNLYANFKYKFLDFSSSPRFWLTKLIIKTNSANKKSIKWYKKKKKILNKSHTNITCKRGGVVYGSLSLQSTPNSRERMSWSIFFHFSID